MKLREPFIERLKRLGVRGITLKTPGADKADFELKNGIRASLRFSSIKPRRHCVTVGGKQYTYEYTSCHFNFHWHGRRMEGVDVIFCVIRGRDDFFCIPLSRIGGKTFCLTCKGKKGISTYKGKYRPYMNTLDGLREVVEMRSQAVTTPG